MEARPEEMTEMYKQGEDDFALILQDQKTATINVSTTDINSIYSCFRQYVGIMVKEMVVRFGLARLPQTLKPYPLSTPVKSLKEIKT